MSMYDMVEVMPNEESEGAVLSGMFGESAPVEAPRGIETITEEILNYKRTAGESILEIGRRLKEAKALLPHGEWLPWLSEKVEFSERSAQNFMRLADAYQNPQTLADLGASKALVLLALNPVERDEFLNEKHDVRGVEKTVPEMSARERKIAEQKADEMERELEKQRTATADAEAAAERARAAEEAARAEVEEAKNASLAVQERTEALQRELKELREKPVEVAVQNASEEQIAAAVKEAEKAAKAKRDAAVAKKAEELKAAEEQRDEARRAVESAEAAKKAAEDQAAALRAELAKAKKSAAAMDNKALAEFGVLFRQAQETVNRLTEIAGELDEENRPKINRALDALRNMISEKVGEAAPSM